jgi:CRISPR system Cascade subunit CasB
MTETKVHPFIERLQELARKEERGALAALRRGLGQPPGTTAEMFRYVEPFNPPPKISWVYYTIASLFALHPEAAPSGNLGAHLAQTRAEGGEDALDRRFTALLSAHQDDLPDRLRQAVSFLKSKDVPVNWNQLFWDLQNWEEKREEPKHSVQKRWAGSFWGKAHPLTEETN